MKKLSLILALACSSLALAQAPEPGASPEQQLTDAAAQPKAGKSKVDDNNQFFREVAKDLRCPTCTGLSVLESDASFSVQIKDQVKEQMDLGKDKDEIVKFFVERYGSWILREPPKQGFNMLAWLVPILLLCLGPILIWLLVWKRRVNADAHGVRATEVILIEMQERLQHMKQERS